MTIFWGMILYSVFIIKTWITFNKKMEEFFSNIINIVNSHFFSSAKGMKSWFPHFCSNILLWLRGCHQTAIPLSHSLINLSFQGPCDWIILYTLLLSIMAVTTDSPPLFYHSKYLPSPCWLWPHTFGGQIPISDKRRDAASHHFFI